ncbi:MAG TPA: hypothetical protein VMA83_00790 [Solirubrobacteraceae bacterium]|nr:hypothetical protein [Solirubrobacteraceae bacterium]
MSTCAKLGLGLAAAALLLLVSATAAFAGVPSLFWNGNGEVKIKGNHLVSCVGEAPCEAALVGVFVQPRACEPSLDDYTSSTSIPAFDQSGLKVDKNHGKEVSVRHDVPGVKAAALERGWETLSLCVYLVQVENGEVDGESAGELSRNGLTVTR